MGVWTLPSRDRPADLQARWCVHVFLSFFPPSSAYVRVTVCLLSPPSSACACHMHSGGLVWVVPSILLRALPYRFSTKMTRECLQNITQKNTVKVMAIS